MAKKKSDGDEKLVSFLPGLNYCDYNYRIRPNKPTVCFKTMGLWKNFKESVLISVHQKNFH